MKMVDFDHVDELEHPGFFLKSFDKRKPKNKFQIAEDEYNRMAHISDKSESLDPRDKLLNRGLMRGSKRQVRAASIRIDRFGRVAFDK